MPALGSLFIQGGEAGKGRVEVREKGKENKVETRTRPKKGLYLDNKLSLFPGWGGEKRRKKCRRPVGMNTVPRVASTHGTAAVTSSCGAGELIRGA